ncbi:MAG TPA: RagB/SusD family nutrient uptake outer membrane protein [Puia sp.]|nr:RagB/SusD family nutrient uptake outer membrane protein [Puia sp.]
MKRISIYISLMFFAGTQFSCKKDLNTLPGNAIVGSDVIVDSKSAQIALNGVYFQLAAVATYGNIPSTYFEERHENAGGFMSGYLAPGFDDGLATNTPQYNGANFVLPMWTNFYQVVNAANGVIAGITALPAGKIPDSAKSRILGEAHFLRAYGHYNLLMYYSQFFDTTSAYGVMLRKEFVTTTNIVQARNTVKESYDYILADIDTAITNAATVTSSYNAGTWAAKALKARLLINRAGPGDYAQVIALTQDVISNGGYALEDNLKDIFFQKGLASKEVILGIYPEPNQIIKHDDYLNYPEWNASQELIDLLQSDPRSTWVAGMAYNQYYGDSTLCITKYQSDQYGEVSYIFRLTEMYLLQAEAITRSGGSLADAKTLLKAVMSKAGVTDFTAVDNAATADDLLIEINKEVVKNLVCEDGAEWFSLLRFTFDQVKAMRPTITDKIQYIIPIPQTELDRNGSIKQNPGYPAQ